MKECTMIMDYKAEQHKGINSQIYLKYIKILKPKFQKGLRLLQDHYEAVVIKTAKQNFLMFKAVKDRMCKSLKWFKIS